MLTDSHAAPLILVVEDDFNHAELIKRSFEDAPEAFRLEFSTSTSGAEAALVRHTPSLVLTDYRLPDGNGSDVVLMAAGLCPVIMMTSHGSERVAVEAMKIGAQDYIVKSPDTFENLPRTVLYSVMTWSLIMARRQSDDAVLRAKKDWERTFDAVPDLISIIDLNHIIIRANKGMAERCGFLPEELIGRKCCEVVHDLVSPPACCPVSGMLQTGQAYHVRVEEQKLNGFFDVTVSPLCDEEGRITSFVHVMRDVTEHKRVEEERQKLIQQSQHMQKLESLGVLSGGIAHDFNNILTIILGHCYIVKESIDSDVNRDTHIRMIETAANRAADLCRQMLAYAGKSPLLQTTFSLWMLVDEIVKMLASAIKKNVIIKCDMKSNIPMVVGDSSQIQQVIMNLIINASEAIGESNGTITVGLNSIMIQNNQPEVDYFGSNILPGSYGCLVVSDTGCGMNAETRSRVFEPFYTTKFAGRGLGMSAILGIVKAHGGTLQLASTPDVGTTFKVYIPLPIVSGGEVQEVVAVAETALSKATVLLVDDEQYLREMETSLLEALGFTAISAANGREALELYKARGSEIDLVMLDLVMPEMGGIEAYHKLRALDPIVPVIICSGYGADSATAITSNDGNTCFLHKPFNPTELQNS